MIQQNKPDGHIQRTEREHLIIAALMMHPALIEASEILSIATFSAERYKKVFAYIATTRENGRPEIIDELILAEATGLPLAEVLQITAGCYAPKPEAFTAWVRELETQQLLDRASKLLQKETDAALKTGERDRAKIAEAFEVWREVQELDGPAPGPAFKRLDEVEGRSISWLWTGRIPLGMISLVAGDPGLGKSFLATWLSSRLSVGAALPGDPGPALTGSTVYLSAEDSPAYALQPRAVRNGADLSKILVLEDSAFDISADLAKIRAIVEKNPDVRLLIIDPLNSYLGQTDYLKDPDVRAMLNPLIEFCDKTGIACLAVMHLNKKTDQAGIYRIGGSIAFAGVARSILAVTQDPEDPERRLLRPIKMNYARKPEALAFRISEDLALTFDEGTVEIGVDDPLTPPSGREALEGNFVTGWIAEHLAEGPVDLKDILGTAKGLGISQSALYRAKDRLRLRSRSSGFGKGRSTSWELSNE